MFSNENFSWQTFVDVFSCRIGTVNLGFHLINVNFKKVFNFLLHSHKVIKKKFFSQKACFRRKTCFAEKYFRRKIFAEKQFSQKWVSQKAYWSVNLQYFSKKSEIDFLLIFLYKINRILSNFLLQAFRMLLTYLLFTNPIKFQSQMKIRF